MTSGRVIKKANAIIAGVITLSLALYPVSPLYAETTGTLLDENGNVVLTVPASEDQIQEDPQEASPEDSTVNASPISRTSYTNKQATDSIRDAYMSQRNESGTADYSSQLQKWQEATRQMLERMKAYLEELARKIQARLDQIAEEIKKRTGQTDPEPELLPLPSDEEVLSKLHGGAEIEIYPELLGVAEADCPVMPGAVCTSGREVFYSYKDENGERHYQVSWIRITSVQGGESTKSASDPVEAELKLALKAAGYHAIHEENPGVIYREVYLDEHSQIQFIRDPGYELYHVKYSVKDCPNEPSGGISVCAAILQLVNASIKRKPDGNQSWIYEVSLFEPGMTVESVHAKYRAAIEALFANITVPDVIKHADFGKWDDVLTSTLAEAREILREYSRLLLELGELDPNFIGGGPEEATDTEKYANQQMGELYRSIMKADVEMEDGVILPIEAMKEILFQHIQRWQAADDYVDALPGLTAEVVGSWAGSGDGAYLLNVFLHLVFGLAVGPADRDLRDMMVRFYETFSHYLSGRGDGTVDLQAFEYILLNGIVEPGPLPADEQVLAQLHGVESGDIVIYPELLGVALADCPVMLGAACTSGREVFYSYKDENGERHYQVTWIRITSIYGGESTKTASDPVEAELKLAVKAAIFHFAAQNDEDLGYRHVSILDIENISHLADLMIPGQELYKVRYAAGSCPEGFDCLLAEQDAHVLRTPHGEDSWTYEVNSAALAMNDEAAGFEMQSMPAPVGPEESGEVGGAPEPEQPDESQDPAETPGDDGTNDISGDPAPMPAPGPEPEPEPAPSDDEIETTVQIHAIIPSTTLGYNQWTVQGTLNVDFPFDPDPPYVFKVTYCKEDADGNCPGSTYLALKGWRVFEPGQIPPGGMFNFTVLEPGTYKVLAAWKTIDGSEMDARILHVNVGGMTPVYPPGSESIATPDPLPSPVDDPTWSTSTNSSSSGGTQTLISPESMLATDTVVSSAVENPTVLASEMAANMDIEGKVMRVRGLHAAMEALFDAVLNAPVESGDPAGLGGNYINGVRQELRDIMKTIDERMQDSPPDADTVASLVRRYRSTARGFLEALRDVIERYMNLSAIDRTEEMNVITMYGMAVAAYNMGVPPGDGGTYL